jgi:hypothetical protein
MKNIFQKKLANILGSKIPRENCREKNPVFFENRYVFRRIFKICLLEYIEQVFALIFRPFLENFESSLARSKRIKNRRKL